MSGFRRVAIISLLAVTLAAMAAFSYENAAAGSDASSNELLREGDRGAEVAQ